MMPTITICIPVYNRESTICDAIDSVIQNYGAHAQILVINNASTDDTSIAIGKYKNQIDYIENNKNIGFAENFKKSIKFARGKYITFLGGDDVLINKDLLRLVEWMERNPFVALVGSDLRIFLDNPNKPTRSAKFGDREVIYSAGVSALTEWWLASTLASIGGWVVTSAAAKKYVDRVPSHTIIPQCYLGFYVANKYDVGYLPVEFFAQRLSNTENQLANMQYLSITTMDDFHGLVASLDNDKFAQQTLYSQLSKMICANLISYAAFGGKRTFFQAYRYAILFDKKNIFSPKFLLFSVCGIILPTFVIRNMLENYRKVR
jgi:glycosyltransferase involved in cell wall biosynthesis